MSRERSFLIEGGGHIRVIAQGESIITDLVLSHVSREVSFGDYMKKLAELKREWISRTYQEWIDGKTEARQPAAGQTVGGPGEAQQDKP